MIHPGLVLLLSEKNVNLTKRAAIEGCNTFMKSPKVYPGGGLGVDTRGMIHPFDVLERLLDHGAAVVLLWYIHETAAFE